MHVVIQCKVCSTRNDNDYYIYDYKSETVSYSLIEFCCAASVYCGISLFALVPVALPCPTCDIALSYGKKSLTTVLSAAKLKFKERSAHVFVDLTPARMGFAGISAQTCAIIAFDFCCGKPMRPTATEEALLSAW